MMYKKISLFFPLLFIGCQTGPNPIDPYEDYNRQVFEFNEKVDKYVWTPVTTAYKTIVPEPFRLGVTNFYYNAAQISYFVNAGFQGEWKDAYEQFIRFAVNTTFGVGGVFDMASSLGIERKRYDFGQTMYHMGYTDSAYYVMPIFGPGTVRDTTGLYFDRLLLNPLTFVQSAELRNALFIGDIIDTKSVVADYLDNFSQPAYVADKYIYMRDLYLQYRNFQLNKKKVDWDSFYGEEDDEKDHEESNK
jgi:phospholipid-binding lipoprotein MlaA